MKLCYQVATPDVSVAPSVTAFQGDLEHTFSRLAAIGYDGAELMTLNPAELDWNRVKHTAERYGLAIPLVCTGEIFGQLGLSFSHRDESIRRAAVDRVKEIIAFAGFLGANVNIGRVRGQYSDDIPKEQSYRWAVAALREISTSAEKENVKIALETVTLMQTNFINTLEEAVQLIQDVNHPSFGLMMDVFHLNLEEKNIYDAIWTYRKYNLHVHLADNNRRYPGHCGLDFLKIIQCFRNAGYDGAFSTEIFQIPDQERAAQGAMTHLGPILKKVYGRPCSPAALEVDLS